MAGNHLGAFLFHVVCMALMTWSVQLLRKTMKDYMFADGTFLAKGMPVGIGVNEVHFDDKLYDNSREFEPFQFVNAETTDDEGAKYLFVSTGQTIWLLDMVNTHGMSSHFPLRTLTTCYQ